MSTPGPWKWFETEDGRCRINPEGGGLVIAECAVMEPFSEEQRSNARLIAAAPDLLEALHDCVSVMERELGGLRVIQPELAKARAAIDKAHGDA
jgi:hypothetical protein